MAGTQRRIGPSNLGRHGIIPPSVNGGNPITPQSVVPKVYVHFGSQSLPISPYYRSGSNYVVMYPYYLVDVYPPSIIVMILIGISLVPITPPSSSGRSKHSIFGTIRPIPQSIPSESQFNTIIPITIRPINELPNTRIYIIYYILGGWIPFI